MAKQIKSAEEILDEYHSGVYINKQIVCLAMEAYHNQFKKRETKPKIEIPQEYLIQYNELWPEHKLPTGKYGRCSLMELNSAFQFFFKTFPDYNDWAIILQAAQVYLAERENDKWEWTRRSKYFVRREAKDKSWESELSEYYQRIKDGTQESPQEQQHWEPKII